MADALMWESDGMEYIPASNTGDESHESSTLSSPTILKVYGPYINRQDRRFVILKYLDGSQKSMSYARFLLEQKLGRSLTAEETADHIDDNKKNDSIENLQILSLEENIRKYTKMKPAKLFYFICPVCNEDSVVLYRQYKHNQLSIGRSGPYCSKHCAGKIHN